MCNRFKGDNDYFRKELIEYASQNLAKFKIPDKFIFCNEIPKGPTGKLQRIGLSKTLGLDDEQL